MIIHKFKCKMCRIYRNWQYLKKFAQRNGGSLVPPYETRRKKDGVLFHNEKSAGNNIVRRSWNIVYYDHKTEDLTAFFTNSILRLMNEEWCFTMINNTKGPQDAKVKSLVKAMRILECFSVKEPELGITQLARMTGANKSSVYNIVHTFNQLGYLEQKSNSKYCLGAKMLEYSFIVNEHLGYPRAVYDILQEVSQQSGEIVYFGIPSRDKVLYLYVVHPRSRLGVMPYREILGETAPLYCTGIGKAMLAFLPETEWPSRITDPRVKFTDRTVTDYDTIIEDLIRCHRRGYSIDDGAREPGIRCVGMPVYDFHNRLVAGVSISGPMESVTYEKIKSYVDILQDATFKMRERLY